MIKYNDKEHSLVVDGTDLEINGVDLDIHNPVNQGKFQKAFQNFKSKTKFKIEIVFFEEYNYCCPCAINCPDANWDYCGKEEDLVTNEIYDYFDNNNIVFE